MHSHRSQQELCSEGFPPAGADEDREISRAGERASTVGQVGRGLLVGPSAASVEVVIRAPPNLKPRALKAWLRNELAVAADAGDLARVRALAAGLQKIDTRADRRAHRDGLLRRANRENPYDPNLVKAYDGRTIPEMLAKAQKSIRLDFGPFGVVTGIASILKFASESIGQPVTDDVLRAQTKAITWKLKERVYGLGYEFTTDANQVLRVLAELQGSDPVPQDKFLKGQPLPGRQAWDAEFEADWEEWKAGRAAVTEAT